MPVLQFKGKTAVECYHHTVPHHVLEFDPKLSVLGKGEKPGLDGNLIIEGDNLLALKALLPTHAGRIKGIYIDVVRLIGRKQFKKRTEGLGGSSSYAQLGPPLFGEYRDFGTKVPSYEEPEKYIFYTETSRDVTREGMNEKTGRIGEYTGTSYYESADPQEIRHRLHGEVFITRFDAAQG